jgi:hypothetical protein
VEKVNVSLSRLLRRVGEIEVYLHSFFASAVEVKDEIHVPAFLSLAKVPAAH